MNSSDESPAVVELPGNELEQLRAAVRAGRWEFWDQPSHPKGSKPEADYIIEQVYPLIAARVRAEALERRANAPAAAASETDVMRGRLRSRAASSGIVGEGPEMVDAFERAVRAEAVAGERRRIENGLLEEFYEDNPPTDRDHGYNAGIRQALWVMKSGFAAGSVPVATPDASPIQQHSAECGGPAICSNLRCRCACHFEGPGPVATPTEPALTPDDCTCEDDGGCVDYYDEDRPGDCAYCQDSRSGVNDGATCPAVLRVPAASPVPAEQPEERAPSRICDCGHLKERHTARGRCELCGDGCRSVPTGQEASDG